MTMFVSISTPMRLEAVDFLLHDGLGQTELRNAVHQHAARQMQRLENRDLIAQLRQVARRRSGRTGPRR